MESCFKVIVKNHNYKATNIYTCSWTNFFIIITPLQILNEQVKNGHSYLQCVFLWKGACVCVCVCFVGACGCVCVCVLWKG